MGKQEFDMVEKRIKLLQKKITRNYDKIRFIEKECDILHSELDQAYEFQNNLVKTTSPTSKSVVGKT